MKSNKGITLISLMIYIIVLSIVIGIIATFTRYFYRNSNETSVSLDSSQQYIRVIEYLTEDVNANNVKEAVVDTEGKYVYIYFSNNIVHQYLFNEQNKKIYYISWDEDGNNDAKIELSSNVETCEFKQDEENPSKIYIKIVINSIIYNIVFMIQ